MTNKANKAMEDWVRNIQSSCAYIGWVTDEYRAKVPVCKYRKNAIAKCIYKRCPKVNK